MKKIIAILGICMLLTGCGTKYDDAETTSEEAYGGYFTMIKEWGGNGDSIYQIVYANDTKVKYFIWKSGYYKGGMTPLYNADGSLQVYTEDE